MAATRIDRILHRPFVATQRFKMDQKLYRLAPFQTIISFILLVFTASCLFAQPAGFVNEKVADTYEAIGFNFLPDGRVLILEKSGTIRIGDPSASKPIATSVYMTVTNINTNFESGLLSIEVDPNFSSNNYFYLFYSYGDKKRRVSRFEHQENSGGLSSTGNYGSELLLWEDTEPAYKSGHMGGAMVIGNDGKIYFATGDGFETDGPSQDYSSSFGKLHRINTDGTIPPDNPFYDGTPGIYNSSGTLKSIFALGLRNPFRGGFDPVNNRMLIAEVGGNQNDAHEDIHSAYLGTGGGSSAGKNYGWPQCGEFNRNGDGSCVDSWIDDPIFAYRTYPSGGGQVGTGGAVIGGSTYRGGVYPGNYDGAFFYGDYVREFMKYLTFDGSGNVNGDYTFQNNIGKTVEIRTGPDGLLYYLRADAGASLADGSLHRYLYNAANSAPGCTWIDISETEIDPGETISVEVHASDPDGDPMTYEFEYGDGATSNGTVPGNGQIPIQYHNYSAAGTFTLKIKISDGNFDFLCTETEITVGSPPVANIVSPTQFDPGFVANDVIVFAGSATGGSGGLTYKWTVEFVHDTHTHPTNVTNFLGQTGTFTIPDDDHGFHGNTGYKFILTVSDGFGLEGQDEITIWPDEVDITLNANVSQIDISVNGIPTPTPQTFDEMKGFQLALEAPISQCVSGVNYEFMGWSDGESANSRVLIVPSSNTTITANYSASSSLPSGWNTQDIGFVAATGSLCFDAGGVFAVSGSGEGIQGIDDEFHFVYQTCEGDAEIIAQVSSIENIDDWSRAGLMIRDDLTDDTKSTFIGLAANGNMSWHTRTAVGANSSWSQSGGIGAPKWLKITRLGDDFLYAYSENGINWTDVGQVTVDMDDEIYLGLAVTAQDDGQLALGEFTNVSFSCDNNIGIFPVELQSFSGYVQGEDIVLDWLTNNEEGNDFFTLERSLDGQLFEVLGKVQGQGPLGGKYSYTDINPVVGSNFYRLKQTDLDGQTVSLETIEVVFGKLDPGFIRLFPNPTNPDASTRLELDLLGNGHTKISLVNSIGQTIKTQKTSLSSGRHQFDITTEGLKPGYYMVIVEQGLTRKTAKLIIAE